MTLDDSVAQFRLHAITRATEVGNVSQVCRELGISRTLFYRWRKRYLRYGPDGLVPKRRGPRRGRPPQVSIQTERRVIAQALAWPTWGPQRVAAQLKREGVQVAPTTAYRILRRAGLGTAKLRLAALERHSAATQGLLTERTRRTLAAARRKGRHVEASRPGELVCMDTFFVGKLKGVGKVWQYTACDAASSFALARVAVGLSSEHAAAFLTEAVIPFFATAGCPVERVLTDGGSEYKAAFSTACRDAKIEQTRIKPGHAWTNGFVERLQGTVLREHWKIAFRRHYFTSVTQLNKSLERFLEFYNWHRPHLGYRTKGRTPGQTLLVKKEANRCA